VDNIETTDRASARFDGSGACAKWCAAK